MESRIKDGNFYVVQSFMVKDFKLKGLEKDIYAIIYGFSQAENQTYNGSLKYLADWTNSSKQGVLKALNSLQQKGLISKKENIFNGVKFVEYYSTEFNGGIKQSLNNNINNSIENNIKDISTAEKIINHLNEVAGTKFRPVESNLKFINARLKDYDETDLLSVIDKKVKEWKGTKMQQYLRPETLFNATKFETYVNGLNEIKSSNQIMETRKYNANELNSMFDNLEDIEI